ncbi:LacI family DNA-binding transcriptional regulator [Nocardia sp. NPDC050193]
MAKGIRMAREEAARRVTAADVARSLGLSRATVGFVLNDTPGQTISPATRERVLAEAKRLGYRANSAARALASGRSRIVLLILPDWPIDYSMRGNIDEASLALDRAGYALVTMTPHPDGQAQPLWESLGPHVVLSIVPLSDGQRAAIVDGGVAHVVAPTPGGDTELERGLEFAVGPRLQAEHLLERGRRAIAFAGSTDARIAELVAQRRSLAADTLRAHGTQLHADADLDAGNASAVVSAWLERGVDAVVAYNDDIAALVVGAALRQGIAVPDRLGVIGHDDSPIASLFVPALSSIRVDTVGLGRRLAATALSVVEGTQPPTAGPESRALVVARETT